MKILVVALGTVLVGGIAAAIVGLTVRGGDSSSDAGVEVRVEPAARGELIEVISAPGEVQPRTKVQISARVAARIIEMPFDEGQKVTRGDPKANPPIPASMLVKLDATDLEAQLRAAEARAGAQKAELAEAEAHIAAQAAQIAAAQVMLEDAQRDYRRQKELLANEDVSQSVVDAAQAKADQQARQLEASQRELEASKLNLTVLERQIDAADAEIAQARDSLGYTTIYSPIDGIVTRVNAKVGEMVVMGTMNTPGTVILEVSDLSQMQVDAQIDENNIAVVKEGQKAKVRISAYPDRTFDGVVRNVGLDTAEDQRSMMGGGGSSQGKWYKAKVVLASSGRRIPAGLSADVDIETNVHRNVIKAPTQAVLGQPVDEMPETLRNNPQVDQNKTIATVVYRYENGKAVMTPVKIGASDMTDTLIEAGLKEGDRIITGPYKVLPSLKNGMKVREQSAPPATKPATRPVVAMG